ncbi:hypothetical protein KCP77_14375 [Salmonella enterica subsp. enterica]|nr:hypothetical protein KCP77_14375 [Salmonella enterica subsp. enterica]
MFVPNTPLNQFRREAIDMLDAARLAHYQRGRRKPVAQLLCRFIRKRIISAFSPMSTTTKRGNFITVTAYD